MNDIKKYLRPSSTIDSDNESIRQKSADLTAGKETTEDKAKSLFYWVRDDIKYDPLVPLEIFEDYRASKTLKRGEGFCVEKAAVLAALARAVGIPARLHYADIRNYLVSERLREVMGTNLFSYHGYTELYIGGKWTKATPAFDLKMCQANRIIPVDFDGKNDAIFHSHNLDGRLHIEYVVDHGCRVDVPVEEIIAAWNKHYGIAAQERLNRFIETEKSKKQR